MKSVSFSNLNVSSLRVALLAILSFILQDNSRFDNGQIVVARE